MSTTRRPTAPSATGALALALLALAFAGCGTQRAPHQAQEELPNNVGKVPDEPYRLLRTLKLGKAPHQIVFSADGSEASIAIAGSGRITRVETGTFRTLEVAELPTLAGANSAPPTPLGVAYAAAAAGQDGGRKPAGISLIATQFGGRDILLSSGARAANRPADASFQSIVEIGDGPSFLIPLPGLDGERLLISAEREHRVYVVDAAQLADTPHADQAVESFPTGNRPFPPAPTSDGRKAFVPNHDDGTVTVIDLWNGEVRATVEVGKDPTGGVVLPGDLQYAVAVRGEDRVVFLGVGTHEVEGELRDGIGDGPFSVITSHDGTLGFVNNADSHDVSVIDLATRTVVHRIPTGEIPIAMAIDRKDQQLWVSCEGSHEVQVFALPRRPRPIAVADSALPRTEVAVLGMIHSRHPDSETWNLDHVETTVRNLKPEVICVEIPPNRWLKTQRDYATKSVVEDTRSRVFPEYVDMLFPLTKAADGFGDSFVIEPCAGWNHEMNQLRRARIRAFQTDPEFAERAATYRSESDAADEATQAITNTEDPSVIHSSAYDEATRRQLEPYDRHLNQHIGPGGWTHINQAHYDLIEAAIRKHAGKRILVTFGAGHKHWILDHLRTLSFVDVLDVTPFLP